jgi:hypothetical protein
MDLKEEGCEVERWIMLIADFGTGCVDPSGSYQDTAQHKCASFLDSGQLLAFGRNKPSSTRCPSVSVQSSVSHINHYRKHDTHRLTD